MSNSQLRAADLLRQAADALINSRTSTVPTQDSVPSTSSTNVASTIRSIFAPYKNERSRGTKGAALKASPQLSFWTHRFCLLAETDKETAPTRDEKEVLQDSGLGVKKITVIKDDKAETLTEKLFEVYPKLKGAGGFDLLRSSSGSRCALESLSRPSGGFTSNYLSNDTRLNQAMCYIRPIQRNLDTSRMMQEKIPCQVFETCLTCQDEVPIDELRDHILMCNNDSTEMPPAPKRLKQPPVCQYTCETKRQRANENKTEKYSVI